MSCSLLVAVFLVAGSPAGPQQTDTAQAGPRVHSAPLESGLVRSVECDSPQGTWIQHFRLDRENAGSDGPPLGLLRYVAGPNPGGGVRVDLDLQFLGRGVRVIHTEQARSERRRLVFREVHERGGRTLFLAGTPEAGFQGYELGGSEALRRDDIGAGEFPLLLIESLRLGFPPPQELRVVDPLTAASELLHFSTRPDSEGVTSEARRADGSLRWLVRVQGKELREWRFQDRGPIARAVTAKEFERLSSAHDLSVRVAREAAAAESRRRPLALPLSNSLGRE